MQILVADEKAEEELLYNKSVALDPVLMVDIHTTAFPGSEVECCPAVLRRRNEAVINRN